jgi:hypothetical protein
MIRRTYMCPDCGHSITVDLTMAEVDNGPPECPHCEVQTEQDFKPFGIAGSASARAVSLAETIAAEDYHVADMTVPSRAGEIPKVRYKDVTPTQAQQASKWGTSPEVLHGAIAAGRQTRQQFGSGLDVLQRNLRDGSQPDLIAASRRRAFKW